MLRRGQHLAAVAVLVGCVSSNSVRCPDGTLCPDGTHCATVDAQTLCVAPGDIEACVGKEEFAECATGKRCYQGVCLPIGCGNGRVEPGEVCDDGNNGTGDGCAADCQSNETCGNGVIDLVNGEQCDDAALRVQSHDGCAADCSIEEPRWTRFPMPNQLDNFPAWAYDSKRDRVVLFGGFESGTSTLEWDGRRWYLHQPTISPPSRTRHAMAYDVARERTVLFGGSGFNDTWEWDGSSWTLAQTDVTPPPRSDHTLVYDGKGKRSVLYGGRTQIDNNGLDDTWTWDGATWTQITGAGPGKRFDHGAAYDPQRGVVVLYGGNENGNDLGDTWELSGFTWSMRTPANSPGPRRATAMTYDAARGVLLHGGNLSPGTSFLDTWAFDGTDWAKLPIPDPVSTSSGGNALMTTFAREGTVVVFESKADLYKLGASGWQRSEVSTQNTPNRSGAAYAADVDGGRLLIHSGIQNAFVSTSSLLYNGVWQVVTAGPGALSQAAMAYDETRREFVLFGGVRTNGTYSGETWIFSNGAWSLASPGNSPSPREGQLMAWDGGRIVLFGGRNETLAPPVLGDMWQWTGSTWSPITLPGLPGPRTSPASAYDPIRKVVVMFGGTTQSIAVAGMPLRDTWTWNGTTWVLASTVGPAARFGAGMAWDAGRRRVELYGGASPQSLADQWEWDGAKWEQLTVSTPQAARASHAMTSSLEGFGVVVYGGLSGSPVSGDFARLAWDGPAYDETCIAADLDGDGLVGCDDPDCALRCTKCGNAACDFVESCTSCADCGVCAPTCGDMQCNEAAATCPGDC